jgi:transposase
MGSKKQLSTPIRLSIVFRKKSGQTDREVAQHFKISRSAVNGIYKLYRQTRNIRPRKRSGRPRKADKRAKRRLRRIVAKNPLSPSKIITEEFNTQMEEEKQVSPSLMRQMLLECGLGARIRPKKWEISPINRKKRLEWAKCMLNLSLDDWKRIVFTDESKFEHRVGAQYIRGSMHQSTFDNYAVCSNRWGPSVMVWGAISAEGIFHIEFLNGKVDGAAYKIVLEKEIGHRVAIFQRGELYF